MSSGSKAITLTEQEAAEMMGVSRITLYRLRRDGKIHHYRKLGRLIRYLPQDITDNLAELAAHQPRRIDSQNTLTRLTRARYG